MFQGLEMQLLHHTQIGYESCHKSMKHDCIIIKLSEIRTLNPGHKLQNIPIMAPTSCRNPQHPAVHPGKMETLHQGCLIIHYHIFKMLISG